MDYLHRCMFDSRRVSCDQAIICLIRFYKNGLSGMMASETKDKNPKHINLKVMGKEGNVVQSKIKRRTGP